MKVINTDSWCHNCNVMSSKRNYVLEVSLAMTGDSVCICENCLRLAYIATIKVSTENVKEGK